MRHFFKMRSSTVECEITVIGWGFGTQGAYSAHPSLIGCGKDWIDDNDYTEIGVHSMHLTNYFLFNNKWRWMDGDSCATSSVQHLPLSVPIYECQCYICEKNACGGRFANECLADNFTFTLYNTPDSEVWECLAVAEIWICPPIACLCCN